MRREVYIVGSGGQGVVLMGALLAEAYALKNWNVVQTVVYDAAQRGGLARAEVVMSDVAFSSDALPGAKSKMNGHTVILADESLRDKGVESLGFKVVYVPFGSIGILLKDPWRHQPRRSRNGVKRTI